MVKILSLALFTADTTAAVVVEHVHHLADIPSTLLTQSRRQGNLQVKASAEDLMLEKTMTDKKSQSDEVPTVTTSTTSMVSSGWEQNVDGAMWATEAKADGSLCGLQLDGLQNLDDPSVYGAVAAALNLVCHQPVWDHSSTFCYTVISDLFNNKNMDDIFSEETCGTVRDFVWEHFQKQADIQVTPVPKIESNLCGLDLKVLANLDASPTTGAVAAALNVVCHQEHYSSFCNTVIPKLFDNKHLDDTFTEEICGMVQNFVWEHIQHEADTTKEARADGNLCGLQLEGLQDLDDSSVYGAVAAALNFVCHQPVWNHSSTFCYTVISDLFKTKNMDDIFSEETCGMVRDFVWEYFQDHADSTTKPKVDGNLCGLELNENLETYLTAVENVNGSFSNGAVAASLNFACHIRQSSWDISSSFCNTVITGMFKNMNPDDIFGEESCGVLHSRHLHFMIKQIK